MTSPPPSGVRGNKDPRINWIVGYYTCISSCPTSCWGILSFPLKRTWKLGGQNRVQKPYRCKEVPCREPCHLDRSLWQPRIAMHTLFYAGEASTQTSGNLSETNSCYTVFSSPLHWTVMEFPLPLTGGLLVLIRLDCSENTAYHF